MARVLVVEDDDDIRAMTVARITVDGHAVLSAANADDAFAIIKERGAPEIAVLDVGLPVMNGLEFLVALRERLNEPNLPAVFLSARVSPEDVEAGRQLNATYLTKPYVATALLKAINRALPGPGRGW